MLADIRLVVFDVAFLLGAWKGIVWLADGIEAATEKGK